MHLLFVTVQTFRKDERRSGANKWQRLNDQTPKRIATEGFKPRRRRLYAMDKTRRGSKPKGKARQWTDGRKPGLDKNAKAEGHHRERATA